MKFYVFIIQGGSFEINVVTDDFLTEIILGIFVSKVLSNSVLQKCNNKCDKSR